MGCLVLIHRQSFVTNKYMCIAQSGIWHIDSPSRQKFNKKKPKWSKYIENNNFHNSIFCILYYLLQTITSSRVGCYQSSRTVEYYQNGHQFVVLEVPFWTLVPTLTPGSNLFISTGQMFLDFQCPVDTTWIRSWRGEILAPRKSWCTRGFDVFLDTRYSGRDPGSRRALRRISSFLTYFWVLKIGREFDLDSTTGFF